MCARREVRKKVLGDEYRRAGGEQNPDVPESGPVVSLGNVKGAANSPQHPRSQVSLVIQGSPQLASAHKDLMYHCQGSG